ncbi:MAG TPA: VWA domain-containing protein [Xanthobacteraceae bacterium]|nr:VWA domain-containing protein [Xanthobacteraceae bacterium]
MARSTPHPVLASGSEQPLPQGERAREQGSGTGNGGGRLAENILYFARALRAAGLPVGPGAVLDALAALRAAGVGTREDFYWTLHAVFVKRHEHSLLFDQAFKLFFRRRGLIEQLMAMLLPQVKSPTRQERPQAAAQRIQEALFSGLNRREEERRETEIDARLTVSDREILQRKDFAQMTAAEIAEARQAVTHMALSLLPVKTRRLAPHRHGHVMDLRRTLRASMKAGGALIDLKYLGPRSRLPPIVALLDISGSMSQYTRLFLHFLHAVTDARKRVHTFLFGTRLTNVTRALKQRDPDEALAACSASVMDWSGGTRIATSLRTFNKLWARRVLSGGAIVLLFTDGLERDGDERLAFEMDRLHRSCRRLIWLNPLLRFEGFEARAKGIRAMLPHVDEFRPIHNLESVAELCRALSQDGGTARDPRAWLREVA